MKRKFRKLWRSELKKQASKSKSTMAGLGKKAPSRSEKRFRKDLVLRAVWERDVVPKLEALEAEQAKKKDA